METENINNNSELHSNFHASDIKVGSHWISLDGKEIVRVVRVDDRYVDFVWDCGISFVHPKTFLSNYKLIVEEKTLEN